MVLAVLLLLLLSVRAVHPMVESAAWSAGLTLTSTMTHTCGFYHINRDRHESPGIFLHGGLEFGFGTLDWTVARPLNRWPWPLESLMLWLKRKMIV